MDSALSSRDIFIDETERKPNKYAANVLSGVVAVIAIVCLLNEIGVFTLNKPFLRICFLMSAVQFLLIQYIVYNKLWIINPASKYVIMVMVLTLVLTLTTILNIHTVLAYVLPLLLATQYRSYCVSRLALVGSCVCCGVSPILSYLLDTWNLIFMKGYIQTFCRVTVEVTPGNNESVTTALRNIMLYWSLPQILTLLAFGIILYSTTKAGVDSVDNQLRVVDLSRDLNRQLESVLLLQERVLYSMSDIIESRDIETGGHVRRTSEIVRLLVEAMNADGEGSLTDRFCANIIKTAPMHDLGKISVPDTILRKPEKLTDEEYSVVKRHPVKSSEIIEQALTGIEDEELLITAKNIARYHHERYDGTGYPERLSGNDIPLEARIMAIADVYDALVSARCYKAPMTADEAFDIIENCMGTQFDPKLNKYFISCRKDIENFYKT